MTLSRRNLLKTAGLSSLAFVPLSQASAAGFDKEYDIVIIGAGGAGLAAACRAGELGLKAIVLEKTGIIGGSSVLCGGQFSTFGTDLQAKKGKKDTAELFFNDMMKTGKNMNDPKVVKAFVDMSKIQYDFLTKTLNVHPRGVMAASGMSVPRAHTFNPPEVIKAMTKYARDKGVEIVLNASAHRLVTDCASGRVIGVKATINKKNVVLGANKGVILAAGGFSRNPQLLAKFNPIMAKADAIAGAGTQGDGLLMAQAYGADVADMPYIKATYGFAVGSKSGQEVWYPFRFGAIVVNKKGQRICDESISKKDIGDKALEQENGIAYCVYDEPINEETIKDHGTARYNYLKGLGVFYSGNTLEEAAKKAGIDPKGLAETVKQYNDDVLTKGADSVFGRKFCVDISGKLVPINKGPFYIYPSTPVLVATYCGVKVDPRTHVIDVFGKPIKGLYAAGEVSGGVHGQSFLAASAISKSFTMGYIAADELLKNKGK